MAIIAKDYGKHIGNIRLGPINYEHGFTILGVMIGDKNYWGKGYGTEAIQSAVGYAFHNLGLKKINAEVYETNIGSIRAFQKAGFQEEGRRKRQYFSEGKFIDAVCFSINRDERPEYQKKIAGSMDEESLRSIQLEKNKTVKEAMNAIDKNGIGTVLVVDNKKVIGIVTDGDIRRAVMAGHDVNSCVDGIMNKEPVLIKNTDLMDSQTVDNAIGSIVRRVTNDSERFIPIVNDEGQVIDLVLSKNLRSYHGPKARKVKKILIAGGAGYLGSILARKLLERNYKVRVLDTLTFGDEPIKELLNHENFELVKGDIRNIEIIYKALKDIDSVVHLAAVVGDPACKQEPESTIEINYLATYGINITPFVES
ncbi:MAG: GNAT family N-acetyltransferase, partial [Nanoarchaeota archaeon]